MKHFAVSVKVPIEYEMVVESESVADAITHARKEVIDDLMELGTGETIDGCLGVALYEAEISAASREATEDEI